MPIVFAQPDPVGAAASIGRDMGLAQAYQAASRGGGGGHTNVIFPPTVPAPTFHMVPNLQYGENPVDAQLRLDQGRLTMAEEMRLQRLQAGMAEVDANDNLSEADKADLKMQISTGIHPLEQRRARAAIQMQEQQTNMLMQRDALMTAMGQGRADEVARLLAQRTTEWMDPNIEEMVRDEYDRNMPEQWASDDPAVQADRRARIRARVAELGGLNRVFAGFDGSINPMGGSGGRGMNAAIERPEGGGTGTGSSRGAGGAPSGIPGITTGDLHNIESEVDKILAAREKTENAPGATGERVTSGFTAGLGERVTSGFTAGLTGGALSERERMIRERIESRQRLVRDLAPPPPRQDWWNRGREPQRPSPFEGPPASIRDRPFSDETPVAQLTPVQQELQTMFSRTRERISREAPEGERRQLYRDLDRVRNLIHGFGSEAWMRQTDQNAYEEWIRLTNKLTPYSRPRATPGRRVPALSPALERQSDIDYAGARTTLM